MDSITDRFKKARILVVGDIMLDRYVWGEVGRISPEAPVPVVRCRQTTETLGGAGNVALNLVSLGCQVTVVGVCGRDLEAAAMQALLAQKGIDAHLTTDESRPTTTKTRVMANKQQMLRLDNEQVHGLQPDVYDRLWQTLQDLLGDCNAIIISDYGKGTFDGERLCQEVIGRARQAGVPVLVDPKGGDWQRYRGASGITPNTAELAAVTGRPLEDEKLLTRSAKSIRQQCGLDWLLVTRGPRGMTLIDQDCELVEIKAQAREVYDVSGAGDTVVATMAAALAVKVPLIDAARTANLAAGIVVGKLGTKPILVSELSTAIAFSDPQHFFPYAAAKMTALDAASAKVDEWRAAGDRIVFTNGCFDLLHPGHISLLYQARALGDRLVIGLNTDASIKRLKGSGRPILAERDRAAMLSALECVDLVVHFGEDTPLQLIELIRPDVLVKGSDYTPDQVVGKALVESYGGCVKLVDLVQGYSTTKLAEKVASESGKK